MKEKPKNTRLSKRVAAKRPARIKKIDDHIAELQGQTRDISMRGVFIYLDKRVMEGSTLEVILPLPEGITEAQEMWVRCKCRVVRVEDTGDGKEFGVGAIIEEYEPLADAAAGMAQA